MKFSDFKKLKKNRWLFLKILCSFGFIIILVLSTLKLFFFHADLEQNKEESESLIYEFIQNDDDSSESQVSEEKVEDMKIDFAKLKEVNSDVVGWLVFNEKKVNNPIVHGSDNEYYLTHSFKRSENSLGSLFMDYRNQSLDDQNVVIFGHNTPNKTMFGSLDEIFDESFFARDHATTIYLFDVNHQIHHYQIFSYYVIDSEEYYITPHFATDGEFQTFLNAMKGRSFREFNVELTPQTRVLTFSTCAGNAGTNRRVVIHAARMD